LLVGPRGEADAVRPAPQVGPLPDGDEVVALRPELAGDLRREVLVEERAANP
jgi:hypothetical protein